MRFKIKGSGSINFSVYEKLIEPDPLEHEKLIEPDPFKH